MTSQQARAYLDILGDQWLTTNRADMGKRDPISELIEDVKLPMKDVLEVGCSNGWRLKRLREKYGVTISGLDPSAEAVKEANEPTVIVGTADNIQFPDKSFDVVILGFCLYAIAPEDWFKVVAETDRVLKNGGFIIIWDWSTARPCKRKLVEEDVDLYMLLFDWPSLWKINPIYTLIAESNLYTDREMVTLLRKNTNDSLPLIKFERKAKAND